MSSACSRVSSAFAISSSRSSASLSAPRLAPARCFAVGRCQLTISFFSRRLGGGLGRIGCGTRAIGRRCGLLASLGDRVECIADLIGGAFCRVECGERALAVPLLDRLVELLASQGERVELLAELGKRRSGTVVCRLCLLCGLRSVGCGTSDSGTCRSSFRCPPCVSAGPACVAFGGLGVGDRRVTLFAGDRLVAIEAFDPLLEASRLVGGFLRRLVRSGRRCALGCLRRGCRIVCCRSGRVAGRGDRVEGIGDGVGRHVGRVECRLRSLRVASLDRRLERLVRCLEGVDACRELLVPGLGVAALAERCGGRSGCLLDVTGHDGVARVCGSGPTLLVCGPVGMAAGVVGGGEPTAPGAFDDRGELLEPLGPALQLLSPAGFSIALGAVPLSVAALLRLAALLTLGVALRGRASGSRFGSRLGSRRPRFSSGTFSPPRAVRWRGSARGSVGGTWWPPSWPHLRTTARCRTRGSRTPLAFPPRR